MDRVGGKGEGRLLTFGVLLLVLDRLEQDSRHGAYQLHGLRIDETAGLLVPRCCFQVQAFDVDTVFRRCGQVLVIGLLDGEVPRQRVNRYLNTIKVWSAECSETFDLDLGLTLYWRADVCRTAVRKPVGKVKPDIQKMTGG